MRTITKRVGFEPTSLSNFKRTHPYGKYSDLEAPERNEIRIECAKEQHFLCAYCSKQITGTNQDSMNEHVEARHIAPNRSLDFTNIVASCTTPRQCDESHGSQPLPLTPFMEACESELQFKLSGKVIGLSERAKETIRVLNLGDTLANNRSLIEQRKQLTESLLLVNGIDPNEGLEDDELIDLVLDDITTPIDGKLEAFSPVLVNILKQWID
ncbi:retron system putative HNH endonuclease [Planctobacterium marinum]|uniref:retron system putative HNH endonuclease n=1 Tax=Planctobacterium marinum TaxID=1631968 RepID=UPI001E3DFD47|nr:retron system putative HNH endonuclease [Planctobacterium marinum]MCC2607923.1 TIGR02646 family protein [Planctobacterium marinum]